MIVKNLHSFSSSSSNEVREITFSKENWFQLRKNEGDNSPLNYDTFMKELEVQVKKNLLQDLKQFVIADLKVVVSEKKYYSIDSINSEYLPTLSYHATTSTSNVNSIVNHGYLLPSEVHPTSNQKIKMANGNFYGTGIYSFLNKDYVLRLADQYRDDNRDLQIIINLVNMIKPYIMNKEDFKTKDKKNKENKQSKEIVTNINGNILPYYLTPDLEGNYFLSITDPSKVASSLIFDNTMVVTGSAKNIIPVCVVTISRTRNPGKILAFTLTTENKSKKIKKMENENSIRVANNTYNIEAIRICNDIYMFCPNLTDTNKTIPVINYYFLVANYFLTIENKNTLEHYISTKSNTDIYIFDAFKSDFANNLSSVKLRQNGIFKILERYQNNVLKTLKCVLDKITTSHNNNNILYFFSINDIV